MERRSTGSLGRVGLLVAIATSAALYSGATFLFHGAGRANLSGQNLLAGSSGSPNAGSAAGLRGVQLHAVPPEAAQMAADFTIFGVNGNTFFSQFGVALVPALIIELVVLLTKPDPTRDYVAGSDNTIKVQRAFDFEAWEQQRKNPERYWQTLAGLLGSSTMLIRLQGPLFVLNVISATVLFYQTYMVPQGLPSFALPALPFTISSFALGLLLVFRVNNANNRYVRARNLWGSMLNVSRDLCQQSALWAKSKEDAVEFCRWVPAFTTSLMCFLRDPRSHDLGEELTKLAAGPLETAKGPGEGLTKESVDGVVNRPAGMVPHHYVLFRMRSQMENFDVSEQQRLLMESDVTRLINDMGACENVFATPIPVGYTKHTARFLFLWLMLLPLALQSQLGVGTVFAEQLLAFGLLGIEDIGITIEEPFSVLPLKRIAGKIALEAQVVRRKAEELDVQTLPPIRSSPVMAALASQ